MNDMPKIISTWIPAKIKFYDPKKGYGFAYRDGFYQDIFIHASLLHTIKFEGPLIPDTPVEIQFIKSKKGLHATNLRTLK